MANLVYGNPFGAALEGKRQALSDVMNTAKTARELQGQDINLDFQKWYNPLRKAETQNQTAAALLKELGQVAHYTGDYTQYNQVLQHYLGVNPANLPPGYAAGTKAGPAQTRAADLGSGNEPIPLSYPGTIAAGGVYQALPGGSAGQGTGDPELDALYRQVKIHSLKSMLDGTASPNSVPHMNPMGNIPPAGNAAINARAAYGIPQEVPEAPTPAKPAPEAEPSIWADEQIPTGGQ